LNAKLAYAIDVEEGCHKELDTLYQYYLRQVTYKYLEPVKQSYCSRSVDYGKQWSAN